MKKEWSFGILDDAVNKGSSNISLNKIKDEDGEYPVFGAKGFAKNVSFFHQDKEYLAIIKDGAGIGRTSKHPAMSSILATMQYILPKEGYDIDFVKYFLEGLNFEDYRTGSTIPHVYYKDYRNAIFPLVDLSEQEEIVEVLDKAFAAIDQAKANIEQNIANAKELFQSKLNQIFSQKGEGWVETPFLNLCDKITVGHVGSMKQHYRDEGVSFLRSQNVRSFAIDLTNLVFVDPSFEKTLGKSRLYPGDVAIVRTGYPGTAAVIPESLGHANCSDLVIVRPGKQINPHFVAAFFNSPVGKKLVAGQAVGAAQKHFNVTSAKQVSFPYPPICSQTVIVENIKKLSTETRKAVLNYQTKFASLDELKKSILQKAFAGELT